MTDLAGAPSADTKPEGAPAAGTVLVVDDEKNIRRALDLVLGGEGYRVVEAASAEAALTVLGGGAPVDLAILDVMLPGMSGIELLAKLRQDEATRELPVIVISGHATVQDALSAVRLGAVDFFEKPVSRERVLVSVANALRSSSLAREVRELHAELDGRREMIGRSAAMTRLHDAIARVAPTKASVLITGESGTGKELVSRAIHALSARSREAFVRVNCAAIPRELIESELFGHERGAFTGAESKKRGLFEQAHKGTLFLDEIGDMDHAVQAKVLRALQSGDVTRVGGERSLSVDVRVLAATNKDLQREVAAGRFREDLYFRLAVFPIQTPALRERPEDIRELADAFLVAFCRENGFSAKRFDPAAYAAIERRAFPGNVRELKNAVERAAILSSSIVTVADLPEDPHDSPFEADDEPLASKPGAESGRTSAPAISSGGVSASGDKRVTLREHRDRAERDYIVEVLASLDWNISRAAVALGVERTNLHKKIRAYNIRRGEG